MASKFSSRFDTMIRALKEIDIPELLRIHADYYADEFSFPDFEKKFLCAFAATDDDGKIISAGGIRLIPEAVLLTDKGYSVRARRKALFEILSALIYVTEKDGYDQVHAFVQEENWERVLTKIGFEPAIGKVLVLPIGVENG